MFFFEKRLSRDLFVPPIFLCDCFNAACFSKFFNLIHSLAKNFRKLLLSAHSF